MTRSIPVHDHELTAELRKLNDTLQGVNESLRVIAAAAAQTLPGEPDHAEIVLGKPHGETHMAARKVLNAKHKKAGGPPVTFPQLASDGATLNVYDKGGNLTKLDPAATTIAWTSSDDSVITVTPEADPTRATLQSTGKVGSGVMITASFTNTDGSPAIPPAVSDPIEVPAGPPASASITLGVPA